MKWYPKLYQAAQFLGTKSEYLPLKWDAKLVIHLAENLMYTNQSTDNELINKAAKTFLYINCSSKNTVATLQNIFSNEYLIVNENLDLNKNKPIKSIIFKVLYQA